MKRMLCAALALLFLTVSVRAAETTAPTETAAPVETTAPTETTAPAETTAPTETTAPAETTAPTETAAPMETVAPTEATAPTETAASTEATVPAETTAPTEATAPMETVPPVETAAPTDPSQTPGPESPGVQTQVPFAIDDIHIYDGMDRAYQDGYTPQVKDGVLTVVLPLLAEGASAGDTVVVTPDLGDPSGSPVQYRNYQKTFTLTENAVDAQTADGGSTVLSYLIRFDFPLQAGRVNGTYPITLEVRSGDGTSQSFVCYATITDGKDPNQSSQPVVEKKPDPRPRVLVTRYTVSKSPVPAGEDFTVTVILKNMSEKQNVQNLLVSVSCDSPNLVLQNDSADIYLGSLKAGETAEVVLHYTCDVETPAQRYIIRLFMEYDDSNASAISATGEAAVEVAQPVKVELSPFTVPESIDAGETVQLSFQVLNLGRSQVYNVRVELEVPGLYPSGSAFIGNMAAGTSATQPLNVFAGTKEGDARYGYTSGVVRLICEDAAGNSYTSEAPLRTRINELVIPTDPPEAVQAKQEEEARTVQWWVFVVAGAVLVAAVVGARLWTGRRRPRYVKS